MKFENITEKEFLKLDVNKVELITFERKDSKTNPGKINLILKEEDNITKYTFNYLEDIKEDVLKEKITVLKDLDLNETKPEGHYKVIGNLLMFDMGKGRHLFLKDKYFEKAKEVFENMEYEEIFSIWEKFANDNIIVKN